MAAMLFTLLGQLLADHGGGGLREHGTDHEGSGGRQSRQPGRDPDHSRSQRHLRRTEPEHQMPQRVQL